MTTQNEKLVERLRLEANHHSNSDAASRLMREAAAALSPPAAPVEGWKERVRSVAKDHYWDSLIPQKKIVLAHIDGILNTVESSYIGSAFPPPPNAGGLDPVTLEAAAFAMHLDYWQSVHSGAWAESTARQSWTDNVKARRIAELRAAIATIRALVGNGEQANEAKR